MFYYLYKITNLINENIYIGVHKTKNMNDGYMGSGKRIRNAIKKYGIQNFNKEILETFETSDEMYIREKEIVTEEFLMRPDTYNLKKGGEGGWDYLNNSGLALRTGAKLSDENKKKINKTGFEHSDDSKELISKNNGMKNSEEARKKVSESLSGKDKTEEHKKNISNAIKEWHRKRKENAAMA
jgi:hypothetical protein